MSSAQRAVASPVQVTRVVRFTFQIIRNNPLGILGLSAIVAAPAVFLASRQAAYPNANLWDLALALPLATQIVAATLLTATITRMIVPDSAGHYHSLMGSIQAVVTDVPALATIGLFSNIVITFNIFAPFFLLDEFPRSTISQVGTLFVAFGFLALITLGLVLTVLLAMLIPVRIIEQTDLVRTFARGAMLTRGNRWPIFGLMMATIVLEGVGSAAVNVLVGDPVLAGFSEEPPSNGVAAILGAALVATAVSVIAATGTAVLYCELCRIKDGPAPRDLALEFD